MPCTVPHFIVHKDTDDPKLSSTSCWYRGITHFKLFYRLAFFFCSATFFFFWWGWLWGWHGPYVLAYNNGCMFLLTDDIFSVISGCQQNADQMKPAAMLVASCWSSKLGHLWRCSEALPVPETLAMLHTGAMWILHITRSFSGLFNGKSDMCMWAKWAAGLLGYRFLFFFYYCDENTPAIISLLYLTRIYWPH